MRFLSLLSCGLIVFMTSIVGASPGADAKDAPIEGTFIVHEWGTFTSFAGSDGVSLEFRTDAGDDLPGFVLDRGLQYELFNQRYKAGDRSFSATKTITRSLQRMETPVTYFYTDRPRDLAGVRVDFPKGLLTEFFPPVREMMPIYQKGQDEIVGNSFLVWNDMRIIPQEQAPKNAEIPAVQGDDHYRYARETDSALVRISDKFLGTAHYEKFLFYRGVGNFQMPVSMQARGDGRFLISNAGKAPIAAAFLVEVKGGKVRFTSLSRITSQVEASLEGATSGLDALADAMPQAIVADGMYEKEARAMVKTWRSSWFGEEGTRLLYLVPQPLTDAMIPLTVVPAPQQVVRTMVGRLELLTPEQEAKVETIIARLASPEVRERDEASAELTKLGRFAEPSLQRVASMTDDPEIRSRARQLLAKARRK